MQLVHIEELFQLVASGRIEAFALRRHRTNPQILRIRVRTNNRWDELWIDIAILTRSGDVRSLIESMLNRLVDQISPG